LDYADLDYFNSFHFVLEEKNFFYFCENLLVAKTCSFFLSEVLLDLVTLLSIHGSRRLWISLPLTVQFPCEAYSFNIAVASNYKQTWLHLIRNLLMVVV